MAKKRYVWAIVGTLLLFCFAWAAVAASPAVTGAAAGDGEPTTADVVVPDKIEDFRTERKEDGTYKILGLDMDGDFVKNGGSFMTVLSPEIWSYDAVKTGISAVGLRKILGLAESDNAGLTKADDESEEDFAQRVYSALYTKFMQGDIGDDGYTQFKIAIPHTVSEIGDYAFWSGFLATGSAGGVRNWRMPYGYNNKAYCCAFMGYENLANVDFVAELNKILAGESTLTDDEQQAIMDMAMYGVGMGVVEPDTETGMLKETQPRNTPSLVEFAYGKDAEGKRSLKTLGTAVLGMSFLDKMTLPVDADVSYAYGLQNKSVTVQEDGKNKEVSVTTSFQYKYLDIENGVTEIPDNAA